MDRKKDKTRNSRSKISWFHDASASEPSVGCAVMCLHDRTYLPA